MFLCVRLGLGLLPLLDQFRPPIKCGAYSLTPHYLPVVGVSARRCTCSSQYLGMGALVCAGSLPVSACRGLDPWTLSGLCLGSDVSWGLWVHGWICSAIDGCRRGLWARHCSSLRLLHCGCWVVPLGFSPAPLLGDYSTPFGGSPGVLVLWGAFGCLWLRSPLYLSLVQGAGLWLLTLTIAYIYGETLYTQACSHSDPQVFRFRC
ncbi:hypothetical protein ILYODFUR_021072 [Ilyodon furcidens]|uniref:Uncharacterized protein n=1 Tax=Ilyodon furcidens TaxID=33524 RepID=A0ABV0TKE3_9TELE